MNVFRFFRPPGEQKEDRSDKRRAQVRRAQQTYRLRKDQYTRALEKEVSRLRSLELDLVRENQRLRDEVRSQQCYLAEQRSWADLSAGQAIETETYREPNIILSHHDRGSGLGTSTIALPCSEPFTSHSNHREGGLQVLSDPAALPCKDHQFSTASATPWETEPGNTQAVSSDLMDKGMEFVLALEAPCLGHIHGDPDAPDQASGHVLTTSSYVLDLSPSPSSSSLPSSPDSNAASITEALGSAPRTILNRLITLSTALTLEDEVTPVQAWNRIQAHLQLGALRADRLQPLVSKLAGAVKCHGFGAVLKVDIFEKLLREVLIIGPARWENPFGDL